MKIRILSVLGLLLFVQGCSVFEQRGDQIVVKPVSTIESCTEERTLFASKAYCEDVDASINHLLVMDKSESLVDLLRQGAYYSRLKDDLRQNVCQDLVNIYRNEEIWQAGWLLAYSFSGEKSCITHKERLAILKKMQVSHELSPELEWLNEAQIQTLENIDRLKTGTIELNDQNKVNQARIKEMEKENRELQTKIQALITVEQTINKRMSDDRVQPE